MECYETLGTFNTDNCEWNVIGSQPEAPTGLECYNVATFNSDLCIWVVSSIENVVNVPFPAAADSSSYTWSINGETYDSVGTYIFLDTVNCAVFILNLGIVGLSEELINLITISPNPTNGNVLISLPSNYNAQLSIYNSQGKLVFENSFLSNGDLVDLTGFQNGLYIFKTLVNNQLFINRIIKN